jgi:hypothetical protein
MKQHYESGPLSPTVPFNFIINEEVGGGSELVRRLGIGASIPIRDSTPNFSTDTTTTACSCCHHHVCERDHGLPNSFTNMREQHSRVAAVLTDILFPGDARIRDPAYRASLI